MGSNQASPLQLTVSLISGRQVSISVEPDWSVDDLRQTAQDKLGIRGRLMKGDQVLSATSVQQAGLVTGDCLQLVAQPIRLASRPGGRAFAAILGDDLLLGVALTLAVTAALSRLS